MKLASWTAQSDTGLFKDRIRSKLSNNASLWIPDSTALLEWVSEYAVGACTTPDSAVSYLNRARIAQATPSFALWCTTAAESFEKL